VPIVDKLREIYIAAAIANDNSLQLRKSSPDRVDQLLRQLNAMKPRGHIYNPPYESDFDGFREAI
jgi:hypothetical protein